MEQLRVSVQDAREWLGKGGVGVAEMILQEIVRRDPGNAAALQMLVGLSKAMGEHWWSAEFQRRLSGGPPVPYQPDPAPADQFLLIKAWGNGFCSDLDHTLGHLLLAEMTGRRPIIHWGRNSLFGIDPEQDAFRLYFEPISDLTIEDLIGKGYDFFPPKWNEANLRRENQNRMAGDWSRLPPMVFLGRPQRVAVADVYAGVANLAPWLRPDHPMHGRSVPEVYRYLITKYLRLRPDIQREIDEFAAAHLSEHPIIAVHIRASDKHREDPDLARKLSAYPEAIARLSEGQWFPRVFLLTDSTAVREDFAARYGPGLITTDCTRTAGSTGVHLERHGDRRRLGIEVLKDAYLAARCDRFIGLGTSNVSCLVYHLKDWAPTEVVMVGPVMTHTANPYLYMTIDQLTRYLPPEMIQQLREKARAEQAAMTA